MREANSRGRVVKKLPLRRREQRRKSNRTGNGAGVTHRGVRRARKQEGRPQISYLMENHPEI